MLFSGGACSRHVSLFKAVLFSAKMRKAQEREKELGVGRERENFVFVVLFCFVWNAAGGRKERQNNSRVFLGNEEKETNFGDEKSEFFFKIFFPRPLEKTYTNIHTQAGVRGERNYYYYYDYFLCA